MPTKTRTQEIAALFQKYLKTHDKTIICSLSLEELEDTNIDLGWRDENSSWRLAIQNRIKELKQAKQEKITKEKQEEQRKEAKRKHRENLLLGYLGILITVIIALLGWFYFK